MQTVGAQQPGTDEREGKKDEGREGKRKVTKVRRGSRSRSKSSSEMYVGEEGDPITVPEQEMMIITPREDPGVTTPENLFILQHLDPASTSEPQEEVVIIAPRKSKIKKEEEEVVINANETINKSDEVVINANETDQPQDEVLINANETLNPNLAEEEDEEEEDKEVVIAVNKKPKQDTDSS